MDLHHQQQQQQQQNRRRAVEAGGGGAQNHPPSQPCPRCNSSNTKFCYYNNYSLSQPRYFCKGCRRYWTQGGTLRNVPVGGGCRKSKRPKLAPGTTSGGSEVGTNPQMSSLPQPPPPLPILGHQLILNAHDHRLSIMDNNNNNNNNNIINSSNSNNNNNNNITSSTTNTSAGTMMMSHNFFGGGNSGFLPSLMPPMQGVNQPLSFGPNLGLLHGFGLPNFNPQPVQQPPNQDGSLPNLYSTRELGSSSSHIQEWNLSMTPGPEPGPVVPQANPNSNNNNNGNNNDNDNDNSQSSQQWSNFLGTSGLDDP